MNELNYAFTNVYTHVVFLRRHDYTPQAHISKPWLVYLRKDRIVVRMFVTQPPLNKAAT